jgi:hypothetical protein
MRAKSYILAISLSLATLSVAHAQRILGPMTSDPMPMSAAPPLPVAPASITATGPAPGIARTFDLS